MPLRQAYLRRQKIVAELKREVERDKRIHPRNKASEHLRRIARAKDDIGELVKVIVHVDPPLSEARQKARQWHPQAEDLSRAELLRSLSALSIFLKAESEVKTMRQLEAISEERLSTQELTVQAQEFAAQLYGQRRSINDNKLKRLGARIGASRDRYEALAHLAKFYPLTEVPQDIVNEFVEKLGKLEFDAFKKLFAWSLTFYEAKKKGWGG